MSDQRKPKESLLRLAAASEPPVPEEELRLILSSSDDQLQTLLDKFPLAMNVVAEDGTLVAVNQGWEELWSLSAGIMSRGFNMLEDAQFREIGFATFFGDALQGRTVRLPDFEFFPERSGMAGRSRWLRSHLFALTEKENGRRLVAMAVQDITSCVLCEERYHVLVDNANEAIMVVQDGLLKFFNQKALDIAGYDQKADYANKPFVDFVHPDHRQMIYDRHMRRVSGEAVPNFYQIKILHRDGSTRWLQLNAIKVDWEDRPASLAFLYDITLHKKTEEELARYRDRLEELVRERTQALEQALDEVRTLKGLIPVCVSCKDIRDDKGYWKRMEEYIRSHSEADVTHGLCPDCAVKLYPELFPSFADLNEYTQASIREAKEKKDRSCE